MFEPTSRYAGVEDASLEIDGDKVTYKRRRFLPDLKDLILLQEMNVAAGDRLDRIAARIAGDPEQFWRICDANEAMHPIELTSEPGSTLRIARPWR